VIFRQLFDRESCTYTYLLGDPSVGRAALVDTVREHVGRDLGLLEELGLKLGAVLETHVHADHVTGAGELRRRTGATCHVPRLGGAPCADVPLGDGDVVRVGEIALHVLATPGHTSGCVSYLVSWGDAAADRVLTGDALLVRGCGRTDFQEGDAGTLWDSVHTRLFTLPDATRVYPAHDYKGMSVSTIGEEKRHNPRLGGARTRPEFIELMAALDLPAPAKIAEALPANRACGDAGTGPDTGPERM
jgi:glyoxylase-like metal-dependent hydrolase (beta-lactamase superfamily II)